jgi:hypothetical protein
MSCQVNVSILRPSLSCEYDSAQAGSPARYDDGGQDTTSIQVYTVRQTHVNIYV